MPPLCYKQNAEATIARRKAFCEGAFQRRILLSVDAMRKYPNGATRQSVQRVLKLPPAGSPLDGPVDLDRLLPVIDHNLRLFREVADDSLPMTALLGCYGHGVVCEAMGHPVFHHVVGGFGSGSMVVEHVADFDALMAMEIQWDLPVTREMRRRLERAKAYAAGKFFLSPYMAQDGLHLMTNLLGYDRAYMALCQQPEETHALCEKAVAIARDFYEFQLNLIGQVAGGWVCERSDWDPWPCISLNLDDYLCCSNEMFQEFGLPYLQRLIDHFGAGLIHYHTPDTRLLKDVARLRNIRIQIGGDPKWPEPIKCLREIRAVAGPDIPLTWMRIQRDPFEGMLRRRELPGNIEYLVSGARDSRDANYLHALAVDYEAPEWL